MINSIKIRLQNIEALTWQDVNTWPFSLKLAIFLLGTVLMAGLSYALILIPKITQLEELKRQEQVLLVSFEKKYMVYAKMLALRKNIEKEENKLEKCLTKIPVQIDLPQLLEDISVLGAKSEVMLQSIRLLPQNKKNFFVEVPIEMSVHGCYHQLATFLDAIVQLPYLVTFQNIMVAQDVTHKQSYPLVLNLTLKIYQRSLKVGELHE